jgi:hypothetical protein
MALEIQHGPYFFLLRGSVDQLLRVGKIPTCSGSCSGRLTSHPSTHRWREQPQPALREYFEEDGAGHLQDTHPKHGSVLWHCSRKHGYID